MSSNPWLLIGGARFVELNIGPLSCLWKGELRDYFHSVKIHSSHSTFCKGVVTLFSFGRFASPLRMFFPSVFYEDYSYNIPWLCEDDEQLSVSLSNL